MSKVLIQTTVATATRHKLDRLAGMLGRTRANYVRIILETHVKEMPPGKVLRSLKKAWNGVKEKGAVVRRQDGPK